MIWVRFCFCCTLSASAFSVSTVEAQLLGRQNGLLNCNLIHRLQSRTANPSQRLVCLPTDEVICVPNAMAGYTTESTTCTGQVLRTVTESYSVSDSSSQIKEDIKRVKEKLDLIQPGQETSLKSLQEELQEIKEMLKKTTNSTSEVLRRLEVSERLVESMIRAAEHNASDVVETRPVDDLRLAQDLR
jgi:hypothetical protein